MRVRFGSPVLCLLILFCIVRHAGALSFVAYDYTLTGAGSSITLTLLGTSTSGLLGTYQQISDYPNGLFSSPVLLGWYFYTTVTQDENHAAVNGSTCSAPTSFDQCGLVTFYSPDYFHKDMAVAIQSASGSTSITLNGPALLDPSLLPYTGTFDLTDGTTPYTLTVSLEGTASALTPEPSTVWMVSPALAGLIGMSRRSIRPRTHA